MKHVCLMMFFLLGAAFGRASEDDMENLINKETEASEPVESDRDELPEAILFGDATSVELYSAASYRGEPSPLCQPLAFDEIIDLLREDKDAQEVPVNLKMPRVKELLDDACLIKPGDGLMVVGKNFQTSVYIDRFVIRKDRTLCPSDSPYSLWGVLTHPLEAAPLFFSSSPELKEINNLYQEPPAKLEILSEETFRSLKEYWPELKVFSATAWTLEAPNVDRLVRLIRKKPTGDDEGLPNEMIFVQKGEGWAAVAQELVDLRRGSGHVRWEGTMDYNGDGRLDLLLSGDQFKCPYLLLFKGVETGFEAVPLPEKPCTC